MELTLVVLAAGMGSRYGGLKQLDSIGPNGETILDYSVFDAKRAGFSKVVFVIRKDFDALFRQKITNKYTSDIAVEFVYQELDNLPASITYHSERTKPWGTGHAIWCTRNVVTTAFAVINADDFYGQSAFEDMATYLQELQPTEIKEQCMVGFTLKNTLSENGGVSRGICQLDKEQYLTSITERTHIARQVDGTVTFLEGEQQIPVYEEEIVSMNMMGLTPAIFESFEVFLLQFMQEHGQQLKEEFYLPKVINELIQQQTIRVKVLPTHSEWFGVTYREDKIEVTQKITQLIASGAYPQQLWNS